MKLAALLAATFMTTEIGPAELDRESRRSVQHVLSRSFAVGTFVPFVSGQSQKKRRLISRRLK